MFFWVFLWRQSAGEIPKRTYTIFKSRRKLEIYNTSPLWGGYIATRLTPGKYPKEHIQYSNHGEILKYTNVCLFVPYTNPHF